MFRVVLMCAWAIEALSTGENDTALAAETPSCLRPYGSYQSSCRDCKVDEKCTIDCWCDSGGQHFSETRFDLTVCDDLRNHWGQLECDYGSAGPKEHLVEEQVKANTSIVLV